MKRTTTRTIVAAAIPLTGVALLGAPAQAANPKQVLIKEMEATYKGPKSSAGKAPKIELEAHEVARAFVDMTEVGTARKVAKATDGQAEQKGDRVSAQGFRCKATSFKLKNPGTAGEYASVGWRCTFQAADTDTHIQLKYRQRSL